MISAGDFRNGVTFEEDGNVLQVVEFQHVKPGKGAAFVRTKTKNVITGAVIEKSYNPTAKFPTAYIERKDMEYSYADGDLYYLWIRKPMIWFRLTRARLATTSNSLRKIWFAKFFPTRAMFSVLSLPHS